MESLICQAKSAAVLDYLLSKGADPFCKMLEMSTYASCVYSRSAEIVERLVQDERCMKVLNKRHALEPFTSRTTLCRMLEGVLR